MIVSEARSEANRRNSAKSTGPRTEEGKARSRANGLKHGLTGEGIVVPEADLEEVDRRAEEFEAEFRPAGVAGRCLARRAAALSVRLERAVRQEHAALAERCRNAVADFDEARHAEADLLMAALEDDPAASVRKLRRSPEGVDALIGALLAVQACLYDPSEDRWDRPRYERLARFLGHRPDEAPLLKVQSICRGGWGDFSLMRPGDGGTTASDRKAWARERVADLIEEEVSRLVEDRERLDHEAIARDRAGAPDRALFDPSEEAARARKYEAASERGFFKALKELREAREAEPAPAPIPPPSKMASSFPARPTPTSAPMTVPKPASTLPEEGPDRPGPDGLRPSGPPRG